MGAGQGGDEGLEQPGGGDGLDGLLLVSGVQPMANPQLLVSTALKSKKPV